MHLEEYVSKNIYSSNQDTTQSFFLQWNCIIAKKCQFSSPYMTKTRENKKETVIVKEHKNRKRIQLLEKMTTFLNQFSSLFNVSVHKILTISNVRKIKNKIF